MVRHLLPLGVGLLSGTYGHEPDIVHYSHLHIDRVFASLPAWERGVGTYRQLLGNSSSPHISKVTHTSLTSRLSTASDAFTAKLDSSDERPLL
jgi:hypothetical protein